MSLWSNPSTLPRHKVEVTSGPCINVWKTSLRRWQSVTRHVHCAGGRLGRSRFFDVGSYSWITSFYVIRAKLPALHHYLNNEVLLLNCLHTIAGSSSILTIYSLLKCTDNLVVRDQRVYPVESLQYLGLYPVFEDEYMQNNFRLRLTVQIKFAKVYFFQQCNGPPKKPYSLYSCIQGVVLCVSYFDVSKPNQL